MAVRYEWDPVKSLANLRKHGVSFTDAVIALEDEQALTVPDTGHHEYRFRTLGAGLSRMYFSWCMPSNVAI